MLKKMAVYLQCIVEWKWIDDADAIRGSGVH